MTQRIDLTNWKGKLIVSCQALPGEALHGSGIMRQMALAVKDGGAAGIRANSPVDIAAIAVAVELPIIGLWKRDYPDSSVYITPTFDDAVHVIQAGASIVAMDATLRPRPNGESLASIVSRLKEAHPNSLLMADISTYEEGVNAHQIGFDLLSTTLSGYTPYSRQSEEPDIELVEKLANRVPIPVFAEGRIQNGDQVVQALNAGAYAVVVGGAITRPQQITKRIVEQMEGRKHSIS